MPRYCHCCNKQILSSEINISLDYMIYISSGRKMRSFFFCPQCFKDNFDNIIYNKSFKDKTFWKEITSTEKCLYCETRYYADNKAIRQTPPKYARMFTYTDRFTSLGALICGKCYKININL